MDTQQAINLDAMQMFADLGISTAPRPQYLLLQDAPQARGEVRGAEQAANETGAQAATGTVRPLILNH